MKTFIVFLCLMTSLCFGNSKPLVHISIRETGGGQTPVLILRDYTYVVKEKERGIEFRLAKDDAKRLIEISRRLVGKHLSLSVSDIQVAFPKVMDVLKGDGIRLTFQDDQSLKHFVKNLEEDSAQR